MPTTSTSETVGRTATTRRELALQEILAQATLLFGQRGYDATTMKDVADAVGMTRPALYTYVESKEALLAALVSQESDRAEETLREIRERPDPASTRLRAIVGAVVGQRLENPERFRVLDREEGSLPELVAERHEHAKRKILGHVRAVVAEGVDSGEFRACDTRLAALSVIGLCNWSAWWGSTASATARPAIVAELAANAEAMLRAPDGEDSGVHGSIHRIRLELDRIEQMSPSTRPLG